jgi:ribosomal protein S18 acetylase RimI-like enzyme
VDTEIKIEPITERYIESYHKCLDAVARERIYLALVEAPALDAVREFLHSIIAGDGVQFVAVNMGKVVGWCDIIPNKREGFQHNGSLGMGVLKAYRRKGIGEQLASAAIKSARKMGLERVELEVFASNIPAVKLYEKLGFEVEGVKKSARKIDGKVDDLIQMVLFI